MPNDSEILQLCVDLAREALDAGDMPFGSVLVSSSGAILQTDRNRIVTGERGDNVADATLHPEFTLARWAQTHMSADERAAAIVYTSGEHCAMCSTAHGYVGLGDIVYASATEQYVEWKREFGVQDEGQRVKSLAISEVAPGIKTSGPVPGFDDKVKELHRLYFEKHRKL